MQKELYNILKDTSEYKLFKKKSRVRSIVVSVFYRGCSIIYSGMLA